MCILEGKVIMCIGKKKKKKLKTIYISLTKGWYHLEKCGSVKHIVLNANLHTYQLSPLLGTSHSPKSPSLPLALAVTYSLSSPLVWKPWFQLFTGIETDLSSHVPFIRLSIISSYYRRHFTFLARCCGSRVRIQTTRYAFCTPGPSCFKEKSLALSHCSGFQQTHFWNLPGFNIIYIL